MTKTDFPRLLLLLAAALLSVFIAVPQSAIANPEPTYRDTHAPVEARVDDLFGRLTEEEKLTLLSGTGYTTQPIPRLGLAGIAFADAGLGVRGGSSTTSGPATAFPAGIDMASSWDPSLFAKVGRAIGEEARNKGTGVQVELGPGVNIDRTPTSGRSSEYYGEDPYLSAHLAVPFIEGLQSTGVGACVKHFACNNEEVDRSSVNVIVGQRALREIYLPAFEGAVTQAHVWTIMDAYNKVNGPFCSANSYLLKNVLRKEWGFDGMAMSDWGAVHSAGGAVNGGTDLEMPGGQYETVKNLQLELANGHISQSEIDGAVKNILRCMIRCGLADPVQSRPNNGMVGTAAHQSVACQAALEGIVLLKNDTNILPLDPYRKETVALIGPCLNNWQIDTGGSAAVLPTVEVNAYQGIVHRIAGLHTIALKCDPATEDTTGEIIPQSALMVSDGAPGLHGEYYANMNLAGKPVATRRDPAINYVWGPNNLPPGVGPDNFSIRWTGHLTAPLTGSYEFVIRPDDGARLFIGGKKLCERWNGFSPTPLTATINLRAGQVYPIEVDYYQQGGDANVTLSWVLPHKGLFSRAVDIARHADAAIVFVGSEQEHENSDRADMNLDNHGALLIKMVAAANPHTIVVLNNGGQVLMSYWINDVPAVVEAGFPGEYGGKALASILFGDTNPSGKLTSTYAERRQDYSDYGHYPGDKYGNVVYTDGVYVGYRHFDKKGIAPLFPFGYGLSYTTFQYSNLVLSSPSWDTDGSLTATAQVTNTGAVAGCEIAELYIAPQDPPIDRPVRELKGFDRVFLQPGETKTVTFTLTPRDFAYCDVAGKQWRAAAGDYLVEVGGSSRDLPLKSPLTLTQTWTQALPGML